MKHKIYEQTIFTLAAMLCIQTNFYFFFVEWYASMRVHESNEYERKKKKLPIIVSRAVTTIRIHFTYEKKLRFYFCINGDCFFATVCCSLFTYDIRMLINHPSIASVFFFFQLLQMNFVFCFIDKKLKQNQLSKSKTEARA